MDVLVDLYFFPRNSRPTSVVQVFMSSQSLPSTVSVGLTRSQAIFAYPSCPKSGPANPIVTCIEDHGHEARPAVFCSCKVNLDFRGIRISWFNLGA